MLLASMLAGVFAPLPSDRVGFEWDAPPDCPARSEVDANVELALESPLSADRSRRLDVIARVRRNETGGFGLRIWFITDDGTLRRDLEDDDCRLLADAAATLIALNVDALAPRIEPKTEPETSSKPPPTSAVPSEPQADPASSSQRAAPQTVTLEARMGGGILGGPLPGPAGGPSVAVLLTFGGPRLEVGASAWWASPQAVGTGRAEYALLAGSVRGGYAWTFRRFEVAISGGLELGAVRGRTEELVLEGAAFRPFVGLGVGPSLAFRPRPWLSLWFGVDGFGVPVRPIFDVVGVGRIHRAAPFGARATVGIGFRLPPSRKPPRGGDSTNER